MFRYHIRILIRDRHRDSQHREEEERNSIITCIKNDVMAVDLKISLYIAACASLHDGCIHPSPPIISESTSIVNERILAVNDAIPPPESLLAYLENKSTVLSKQTFEILKWLTVGLKEPKIAYIQPNNYKKILKKNDGEAIEDLLRLPEAIFALRYREMSTLGQQWANFTAEERTIHMFLPCNVDDLHSLIYRAMITKSLEQDGSLTLYKNLNHCLDIASASWTWGKSCLGTRLKIIAIAEVVESQLSMTERVNEGRAELVGTPSKYKLTDASYYRPKYLLVYPQEKKLVSNLIQIRPSQETGMQNNHVILAWGIVIILACVLPVVNRAPKIPIPSILLDQTNNQYT